CFQVQRREHSDSFATPDEFFVLGLATRTLCCISRKKDNDRVKVWTRHVVHPVLGTICAGIAEYFRAGDHALPEFLWERAQRGVIYTQRAQAIPCECHRDPAFVLVDGLAHRLRGMHLFQNRRQPRPSACGVSKREKFIASCEGRRAGEQNVLNIVELEHTLVAPLDHCIWSSILENAVLSLSAFLISSALTYGYSPYSRKLGR